jgi:hypothetical protein
MRPNIHRGERLMTEFLLQENRNFPTEESEYSYKEVIQIFKKFKENLREIFKI